MNFNDDDFDYEAEKERVRAKLWGGQYDIEIPEKEMVTMSLGKEERYVDENDKFVDHEDVGDEEAYQLEQAGKPLLEWMRRSLHPGCRIVLDYDHIRIYEPGTGVYVPRKK